MNSKDSVVGLKPNVEIRDQVSAGGNLLLWHLLEYYDRGICFMKSCFTGVARCFAIMTASQGSSCRT